MEIKLCAFDIDGTFLDQYHQVSEDSKRIIDQLRETDVLLVPTTGRCLSDIPSFLLSNHRIDYAITSNGSHCCKLPEYETILEQPFSKEEAFKILSLCDQYSFAVSVHINGINYDTVAWMKYVKLIRLRQFKGASPLLRKLKHKVMSEDVKIDKIQVFSWRKKQLADFADTLRTLGNFSIPFTGGHYVEITHSEATKGDALEVLCKTLGISMKDVLVIGDGENDITMFEKAGHAVAMGNAVSVLKKKASFITASNRSNGFAKALDLFLIKPEEKKP